MSRFEKIGDTFINVGKIKSFWRKGEKDKLLAVELDDGNVLCTLDERGMWQDSILGHDYIMQVVPCVKPLYARYIENGEEFEYPIYYLALCADGFIRPLDVYGTEGMGFADEACNFIGLYSKSLGEERRKSR